MWWEVVFDKKNGSRSAGGGMNHHDLVNGDFQLERSFFIVKFGMVDQINITYCRTYTVSGQDVLQIMDFVFLMTSPCVTAFVSRPLQKNL